MKTAPRTVMEAVVLAALALLPAALLYARTLTGTGDAGLQGQAEELAPDEVSVDTARLWGDAVLWIDARPAAAYAQGHIGGALPLNEDGWDDQLFPVLDALTPGVPVVVYCGSARCGASRAVADRLRTTAGIAEIYVLHGGWQAWRAQKAGTQWESKWTGK